MLRILRRAARQDEVPITTESGLRSAVEDRWREAAKAAGKGASLEGMRAVDPDLLSRSLGCSARRSGGWLTDCRPTAGPSSSGTARRTKRPSADLPEIIAPLGKGEGVVVVEDAGRYEVHRL